MKKRNSIIARLLAVLALAAVIVALVMIVSDGLKSSSDKKSGANHPAKQKHKPHRTKAKTYEVQSGDTLISIAHKTGIPVAELQNLNPEVDPQILIAGQVLKLR